MTTHQLANRLASVVMKLTINEPLTINDQARIRTVLARVIESLRATPDGPLDRLEVPL